MKRIISILLLASVCASMFSGCFFDGEDIKNVLETLESAESELEEGESKTLIGKCEDIEFDGKDYRFTYYDNRLTGIYINPAADGDICIEFPTVSDEGKPIYYISPSSIIGRPLFRIYTPEAHNAIIEQIKENSSIARDSKTYAAFFALKDPNDKTLSQREKEKMLEDYPITQYTPIYVLEPTISGQEADRLTELLKNYTDVDIEYLDRVACDMLELIPDDDELKQVYANEFAQGLRDMKYDDGFDKVTEINFAEASKGQSIRVESYDFTWYKNLEKISGNLSYYMIDGFEVDESFMEELPFNEDFATPFFYVLTKSYKEGYVTVLPKNADDEDKSEPSDQTDVKQFTFGTYSGDLYTRNNPFLSWRLPDSTWKFYTKDELASLSQTSSLLFNETYLNSSSEWLIYDMFANNLTGASVGVNVKKANFNVTDQSEATLHSPITINMMKTQLKSTFGDLCTDVVITPCFVTKKGVNYYALDIVYKLAGIDVYSKNVFFIRNGYAYTIAFASADKNEMESLCNSFEIGG